MIEVNFSPEDMEEAIRVAKLRNDPKMEAGIKSNLFGRHKMNEATSHLNGVMAEMAAAWLVGSEIDKTSKLGGDKGAPDFWKNGLSYEVKFTGFPNGDFIVPYRDPLKFVADIGIVVNPGNTPTRVKVMKWITREDFLDNYHVRDYGAGDRAAISQDKMTDIEELKYNITR